MKKVSIYIFMLALVYLTVVFPVNCFADNRDFPDIHGHWAEEYILALSEKGGITGMPDGNFHPKEEVTFLQFIKIIIGCEYGEIEPVDDGDWASGYLQKALEVGIIDSLKTEFTRYDAARIIAESLKHIYNEEEADDTSIVERFEDYPGCMSCRGAFHATVGQCYVKGIITGKPGLIFDADACLTRAEACIIIMKMIDPSLRVPVPTEY